MRSPAPAGVGAGIPPQEARAARLNRSAAWARSGPPVTSAATVSTSAAAHAMSPAAGPGAACSCRAAAAATPAA